MWLTGSADTTKLAPIDPMSPVAVQPTQTPAQQATVPGSAAVAVQQQQQQSYLNPAAMHPAAAAGYGYYYPGAAGIMSVGSYYTPMIQMGGLVSAQCEVNLFLIARMSLRPCVRLTNQVLLVGLKS